MLFRYFFIVAFFIASSAFQTFGQKKDKPAKDSTLKNKVDSLVLEPGLYNWSIRPLASYKDNKFSIKNGEYTLDYTPNNRFGIGVGLANSRLLLDFTLNIKSHAEDEATKRFDFQGNIVFNQEQFMLQIQNYRGYNVSSSIFPDNVVFRADIRALTIFASYDHIFKKGVKTLHQWYSGFHEGGKSIGSFVAGGYMGYQSLEADSSIVPQSASAYFNESAQIQNMKKVALGIAGGYVYFWKLPKNFFIAIGATPGIGLNFKSIETETDSFTPDNLLELYLFTNISAGYNGARVYVEIRDQNTWHASSLGESNRGISNTTSFKVAVGFKLKKRL